MTAMERTASVKALKGVVTGIATVSRLTGRGGGAVIGGRVALALDKGALGKLAAGRSLFRHMGCRGAVYTIPGANSSEPRRVDETPRTTANG